MELKEYLKDHVQIKTVDGFKKLSDEEIERAELFCDSIKNGNFNPKRRTIYSETYYLNIIKYALVKGKTLIIASNNPQKYIDQLKEDFGENLLVDGNTVTLST